MRKALDLLGIALGAAIFAIGTQGFIVAVKLGGAGVSGIALLVHYLWNVSIGLITAILNIPLLILGWREIGGRFILYTAFGVVVSSFFLEAFKGLNFIPTHDVLLGALYGGVIQGIGGGIVFHFEGSLGGTDIVAKILNKRFGYSIGTVGFVSNVLVTALSLLILGPVVVMYTLVALYVSSKVVDAVVEGLPAKSAMIICQKGNLLAEKIMNEAGRGVTLLRGEGAYTHEQKDVLLCVVGISQLVRLKRLVKQIDPEAFVIVSDAKEVLGKGFTRLG